MDHHHKAMECRDCEDTLQHGIDAIRCLRQAEQIVRDADIEGLATFTPQARLALRNLYGAWLSACDTATRMIEQQVANGFQPDNLQAYRDTVAEVEETVERLDHLARAKNHLDGRFDEEPW